MKTAKGAYRADRAAALAGVPRSTVHYWAREGVLVPSVSASRVKLWSYADLIALRFIYWLRQPKSAAHVEIPATSMPAIRRALRALQDLELEVWSLDEGPRLALDRDGHLLVAPGDGTKQESWGQLVSDGIIDLLDPFTEVDGISGPDLQRPRPHLRMLPGKLSGAPHIEGTRIETEALAALRRREFPVSQVHSLYPYVAPEDIEQALDLEQQLTSNLRAAA